MSAPGGQPSDSHIHLDPAIHPQDSENLLVGTGIDASQRALSLLGRLQSRQTRLPRSAALAWERAVFAEAFDHAGPKERIQAFLKKA
ncbi:MAG TPA: hypothetical protein VJ486_13410 [Geothrix sp.]|nr:hypothetical protein [Geothrix sp.]